MYEDGLLFAQDNDVRFPGQTTSATTIFNSQSPHDFANYDLWVRPFGTNRTHDRTAFSNSKDIHSKPNVGRPFDFSYYFGKLLMAEMTVLVTVEIPAVNQHSRTSLPKIPHFSHLFRPSSLAFRVNTAL